MAILAAPYLEEKLPAQQGNVLRIPFTLNRAVGESDIFEIQIKVKNISTNTVKMLASTKSFIQTKNNQYQAIFVIPSDVSFLVGQFYKAQLAFLNKNETSNDVGEFSTVGVFKYTKINNIKILDANTEEELQQFKPNSHEFIGSINIDDITEKVSEYKFDIYDSLNNLFCTTGYLIHNVENTKENTSIDYFSLTKTLSQNETYSIVYSIKTINNLEVSSKLYSFIIPPDITVADSFPGKLKIKINNEDGYFSLFILFTKNKTFSGSFNILRADSKSNFSEWNKLSQVSFSNKVIYSGSILELFKDFTIEQGVTYKYALQQYSGSFFAKKIICNTESRNESDINNENFKINFEDILLYDGIRQLKIKYNPKISSFKSTVLESKTDTMGSKYPFFFRNGIVKYKEFPISGLISCFMDENFFFLGSSHPDSTDLTYDNILKERDFKLEVLEWLNNGKEKLFRSPTEGNYIIRLMNVSLTPIDTLGRMLHTFSATAYECAECNFDTLKYLHLINIDQKNEQDICYNVIPLKPKEETSLLGIELPVNISLPQVIYGRIYDVAPGTEIKLTFKNNVSSIVIGYTGHYNIQIESENPLIKITVPTHINEESKLEYGFFENESSKFIYDNDNNKISNFEIKNCAEQFTEPCDIIKNIITIQSNRVEQLEAIHYIRFQKKLIDEVWEKSGELYFDNRCEVPINPLKTSLYYALNSKLWYRVDDNYKVVPLGTKEPLYDYFINDKNYILNSGRIELDLNQDKINNIQISDGIYAEIYYSKSSYERSQVQ